MWLMGTKIENQRYYQKNKAKYAKRSQEQFEANRAFIAKYKSDKACKCGETHPACLQFHHRDPTQKDIAIADAVRKRWSLARIQKEINKCDIICANCHLKLHYNKDWVTSLTVKALAS